MLNRLSGTSLRLRVGLAVAMLSGGAVALVHEWGWVSAVVAAVAGVYAAYKTPDVAAYVQSR